MPGRVFGLGFLASTIVAVGRRRGDVVAAAVGRLC